MSRHLLNRIVRIEEDISSKVRNLEVIFDQTFSMQPHVNAIVKMFLLSEKARFRSIFSEEECKTVVYTFVISRLDYCNVLLYGIYVKTLHILQRVQNNAALLIMRFGKSEHITPLSPGGAAGGLKSFVLYLYSTLWLCADFLLCNDNQV